MPWILICSEDFFSSGDGNKFRQKPGRNLRNRSKRQTCKEHVRPLSPTEFKLKLDEDYIGYLLDLSFPPRRRCAAVSPGWKSAAVCVSLGFREALRCGLTTACKKKKKKKYRHSSTPRRAQFARRALELYLSLIYTSDGMRKQLQLLAAVTVNQWQISVLKQRRDRFTCKLARERRPLQRRVIFASSGR